MKKVKASIVMTDKEYELLKKATKLENEVCALEGFGRSTAGEVLGRDLILDACDGESYLEMWLREKIDEKRQELKELADKDVLETRRMIYDFRVTA